jgi:hypothetical protein
MPHDVELGDVLRESLTGERYSEVVKQCLNSRGEDVTDVRRELDNLERHLFDSGYESSNNYFKWKTRREKLVASAVISCGKKRRFQP